MKKSALFMVFVSVLILNGTTSQAETPLKSPRVIITQEGAHQTAKFTPLESPGVSTAATEPWISTVYENANFCLKYRRNGNPEIMTWHVTKLVTSESILDFPCPNRNQEKQPQLVRRIFEIKGVKGVYLNPYAINVVISPAFNRDKIRADIERAILARYGIKR